MDVFEEYEECEEYNMDSYEELGKRKSSILDRNKANNYLCYINENNEVVGYTNMVKKPNGNIFLGIGLSPKYCGKGLGSDILRNSIKEVKKIYSNNVISLQVSSWNIRAIKCYQKVGFKYINKENIKEHNGILTEFVFMKYDIFSKSYLQNK